MALEGASYLSAILDSSNPYSQIGFMIGNILRQVLGIPDPLQLFIGMFSGRPTMEATAAEAQTFARYSSPPLKFLAAGAAHCMHQGIPLSSPQAGPIFGPYFAAANDLEQIIRWHAMNPSVAAVEANTMRVAMHEAGNPGVAGTATLSAIEGAWNQFNSTVWPAGSAVRTLIEELSSRGAGNPQWALTSGWADNWLQAHQVPGAPPPPPGPGPAPGPGGTPPPPAPPPPASVQIGFQFGQQLSGTVPLHTTIGNQAAYPNATVHWFLDNQPIGTGNPFNFDSTHAQNGLHTLKVEFIGQRGEVHAQQTISITIHNQTGGSTEPPPPPPPGPQARQPLQWPWFPICTEEPQCQHLSDEALLIGQQLMNLARAAMEIPAALAEANSAGSTSYIVSELERLREALGSIETRMPPSEAASQVISELNCLCVQLTAINQSIIQSLHIEPTDFSTLESTLRTALEPLHEIVQKLDPECCKEIVAQLKRTNDDNQVAEAWIRELIAGGALPQEFGALVQGTTWPQVLAAIRASANWIWNLGHHYTWGEIPRIFNVALEPLLMSIWQAAKDDIPLVRSQFAPFGREMAELAKDLTKAADAIITTLFGFAANTAVEAYESGLEGIDTTTEAGTKEATKLLLGRALEMGQAAHLLATLPELAYLTKNLGLNNLAAFIAELAGFREVLINTHRPLLSTKLGRPATYVFNRKFPTALPPAPAAMGWWARRKLSDRDARHVAASYGYAEEWDATMFRAAYRPVSPRALATMMQDQPLDRKRMQEILEDNAYSPDHVQFMLELFDYSSSKNVRNSYVNEALAAYQHGVMPDDELHQILDGLGWSQVAKKYVIDRAALARRVTLAQKVEQQIIPLVTQGLISPDVGRQHMEAAGIQPWYTDLEITLATTKAELQASKLEAAAERRAQIAEQRNLTRAAVAEYEAGRINEAGLTAALTALNLEPTLIASIVAVQEAARHGRMKLVYGQLLPPDQGAILTQQVGAIESQFKDKLITLDSARHQLAALKVPTNEIDALLARWATALKKTPGAAVLVNPLTGQLETQIAG